MSLRLRLMLLVMAVILPAVAATLWVVNETFRRERDSLQQRLQETTRALSLVVDRELGQRAQTARVLAESPFLDGGLPLAPEDRQRFYRQAQRATEGTRGWVVLSSRDGQLVNTALPIDAVPPPRPPGAVPPQRFVTLGPELTPLALGRVTGKQVASMQMPVTRQGAVVLNVGVTILPEELQQIVDQQRVPDRWRAAIVDSRNTVVARRPLRLIGDKASTALSDQMRRRTEGYFDSVSLEGEASVAFFSKSPSYGWAFVIAVPEEEFGANVRHALAQALPLIGLLALLALATAIWVWRSIARPIAALRSSAALLGAGDTVLPRPTGLREFDEVHQALADASGQIRNARRKLELEVAQAVQQTSEAQQRLSRGQRIEALGRLTGGVAHDFNNLLAVVGNNVHLLRRMVPDGPAIGRVTAIGRAVEIGSRLTQHLLRFSRHQPMRPEAIELQTFLPDVVELLRTVAGSAVVLEHAVEADLPGIEVDSAELELALINLALNARDAMPAGGTLRLSARRAVPADLHDLAAGDYVVIAVSDTGSGIPPEIADRVFEPFFTTKEVGRGTGLGLSQVHGFCAQAGGAAQLGRREAGGTTIELVLPASGHARVGVTKTTVPVEAPVARSRLLLVEDNQELGDVTALMLEQMGYRVTRAANVGEALRGLEATPVDIVLSDVVMPGDRSGIDLARELRSRAGAPPIVLISGYTATLPESIEFAVLPKPCPPDVLLAALRDALAA